MYFKDSQTGQIFRVNGNTNQIEIVSSVPAGTSLSQGQNMSQVANAYGVSLPGGGTPAQNAPVQQRSIDFGTTLPQGPSTPIVQTPTYAPSSASASTQTSSTSTQNGTSAPDLSSLPPEYGALYSQLEQYLQKLQEKGQVLNPNIQIDPAQTAAFMTQAHNEIDPYYKGQLKLATDTLSKSIGYATGTQQNNERDAQTNYKNDLRTLQGNLADEGFAQSGARNTQESDLANKTQNTIDEGRRSLSYSAGNAASAYAQKYGSSSLPNFNISGSPRVLAGESNFDTSGGPSSLYKLSPDIYNGLTGSEEYQQKADVSNRASQLEGAFRTTQGINQARALNI